jgi:hypothetical protein
VQDDRGTPIAGIQMRVFESDTGRDGTSRQDGSFLVRGSTKSQRGTPVQLAMFEPEGHDQPPHRACAWGDTDVVITLERSGSVELRVFEAGTDVPVPSYQVRCAFLANHSNQAIHGSCDRVDGTLRIQKVRSGENQLIVVPTDSRLLPRAVRFSKPKGNDDHSSHSQIYGLDSYYVALWSRRRTRIFG